MVQAEEGVLTTEENNGAQPVDIKISHITFAFDNVQLIKLLATRGLMVANA